MPPGGHGGDGDLQGVCHGGVIAAAGDKLNKNERNPDTEHMPPAETRKMTSVGFGGVTGGRGGGWCRDKCGKRQFAATS